MPQFPHHSKLCHCCQSIVHLSPGIMAKKSTRDGDLTLTEKLIHGDFPTGEGFFSAGGKKKCIYTHTYTPLAHCAPRSQGYLCLPQAEFSPELSRFTAAWPFCPQELFALEVNLHFPIYMLKSECTGKQTNTRPNEVVPYTTANNEFPSPAATPASLQELGDLALHFSSSRHPECYSLLPSQHKKGHFVATGYTDEHVRTEQSQ